jgi:hypothetical protein
VLENVQWKALERNLGEVFTTTEKAVLKAKVEKQVQKTINFDKQLEKKITMAYDHLDWDKIKTQLSSAVTQARIDSMRYVYNAAIAKMDYVGKELCENDLKGIPDTDITLKEIDQKRTEVKKALNTLNAVKTKKIVHL